jgi:hypothetical protein
MAQPSPRRYNLVLRDNTVINCGRGVVFDGGMDDTLVDGLNVIQTPTAIEVRGGPVRNSTIRRVHHDQLPKIGRNDPCSCGSGKKYKKCCGR